MKPETLERCRSAFDVLTILLDRTPSQKEVARVAPASSVSVSAAWSDLTCDIDDMPRHVQADRRCLGCGSLFASHSAGHRICKKCKGLEAWQTGVSDHAVMLPF